jgi:hypothetical protein
MTEQIPQPQPLPERWDIAVAQLSDGSKQVVVQISGPAGTKVSFLPPDVAAQVSYQLKDAVRQARSGLIVPAGVQLPNGHHG